MSQNFTVRAIGKGVLQAPVATEKAQMPEPAFTEQDWRRLLISLGEDPDRPGLVETPSRVAKAWKHWTSGYAKDPAECLKIFEDGAEQYNVLIVVRGIRANEFDSGSSLASVRSWSARSSGRSLRNLHKVPSGVLPR